MQGRPEVKGLSLTLARTARRMRWLAATKGAAVGLAGALGLLGGVLLVSLFASPGSMALGEGGLGMAAVFLLSLGLVLGVTAELVRTRGRDSPAALIERSIPASRNVVRTAAELLEGRVRAEPWAADAVHRKAAGMLGDFDLRKAVPVGRAVLGLGASLLGWSLALTLLFGWMGETSAGVPGSAAASDQVAVVDVVVRPPSYTGAEPVVLSDPEAIEALEGSELEITVHAPARGVTLETAEGRNELIPGGAGEFTGTVTARTDGFVALVGRDEADQVILRRMMGLTVRTDHPPQVRILDPARDLLFPDGNVSLDLEVEATDEFGLASLEVLFTKATGFGEVFTFTEGGVPLEITREGPSRWIGRAAWSLDDLELDRGDIVVYFARAYDRRPDSPPGESETYMLEIMGSEGGLSGGFAGEDDLDRYALSQQMLIAMTQRLMARHDSITGEEFAAEAQTLAAVQRRIRAEFVFMLGGQLEDDHDHEEVSDAALAELHEEAHGLIDAEAAEGRLEQEGRIELARAIQSMSHAAALLAAVEMDEALRAEETALIFLQRAFSSSRYILRAMTEREELDPSRRLTGQLASAVTDVRPRFEAAPEPGVGLLRDALAEVAGMVASPRLGPGDGEQVGALAGTVLRLDPSSASIRAAAATLVQAADALGAARVDEGRRLLADAFHALVAELEGDVPLAPGAAPFADQRRLDGALADALSGGGDR